MTLVRLHGIANCDTVRKAKKWLDTQSIDYQFIDFRKDGIELTDVEKWVAKAGLEKVLNKRGTTWRKLSEAQQNFSTEQEALKLLTTEPTLIKRPVLEFGDHVEIGFSESTYKTLF